TSELQVRYSPVSQQLCHSAPCQSAGPHQACTPSPYKDSDHLGIMNILPVRPMDCQQKP
uniref:Uncharacterized protein n=1 Tax=Denticeps clupeoides TaxID=299321 RepID=A0AAY4A7W2_9TELE